MIEFDKRIQVLIEACGAQVFSLKQCQENGIYLEPSDFVSSGWFSINSDHIMVNENEKRPGLANLVVLHELIHWSGTEKRLNRPHIVSLEMVAKTSDPPFFPEKDSYITEEVIAMWGMYYLAISLGLDEAHVRGERDRYLSKCLRLNTEQAQNDGKMAADYVLNFLQMKLAA